MTLCLTRPNAPQARAQTLGTATNSPSPSRGAPAVVSLVDAPFTTRAARQGSYPRRSRLASTRSGIRLACHSRFGQLFDRSEPAPTGPVSSGDKFPCAGLSVARMRPCSCMPLRRVITREQPGPAVGRLGEAIENDLDHLVTDRRMAGEGLGALAQAEIWLHLSTRARTGSCPAGAGAGRATLS